MVKWFHIFHSWKIIASKDERNGWEAHLEECRCGKRHVIHFSDCPMDPPYVTEAPEHLTSGWRRRRCTNVRVR